jgi:hypothetical protein
MRALDLDFVQPAGRARRGRLPLLAAAAVAVVAVGLWHAQLQSETQALQSRLAGLERRAGRQVPAATQMDKSLEQEILRVNDVIEQIALPWDRLFRAVEGAAVARVMLLGIAPDAKSGTVQISAETANAETMFEYVRRLEQQPELANVYLLQHRFERQNVARPLQFLVTASWMDRTR